MAVELCIEDLEKLVIAIIEEADYDMAKNLDPETAEEPEFAVEQLARFVEVADRKLQSFYSKY